MVVSSRFIICPAPHTPIPAAEAYGEEIYNLTGVYVPVRNCIEKFDSHRNFIGSEGQRKISVARSFIVHRDVKGKAVIVIDDCIVRGDTSKELCSEIRGVGADEVHFRLLDRPIIGPCYYGVYIPYQNGLIANDVSNNNPRALDIRELERRIASGIGADSVLFQTFEGLQMGLHHPIENYCLGCINLEYPTACGQKRFKEMVKSS
ncbi:MAG: hypothetical protein Q8L29_01800 [archaeon]|nr:hypothetical protein [archaeon]